MTTSKRFGLATRFMAMALMAAMALWLLPGCGGQEPPPPPPQAPAPQAAPEAPAPEAPPAAVPAAPAEAAAPVTPPPAAPKSEPAFKPVTLDVLKLAPAQAQLALALPPLNGTVAKALPFAKRVAPEGVDIDQEWANIVKDMASDAGVPEAQSLNDVAVAKGVSLDAPMALFADFTNSVNSAMAAVEKATADAAAAPVPEGSTPEAAKEAAMKNALEGMDFKALDFPSLALVLGVSDQAKAESTLKELVALDSDLASKAGDPVSVGDIAINVYDKYGYFFSGDKLAVGTLDMVKAVAERIAAPAEIRYGGADCPATAPDEGSMLIYGNRFLPLLKKVLPMMPVEDQFKPLVDAQVAMLDAMLGTSEDPIVSTLAWTDEKIELKSMMDTATHPAILELAGQAAQLKYAQALPEGTVAMISLRLTPEYKKQITEQYLTSLPEDLKKDPGTAQALTMANQLISMLGEEITLGISGVADDFPAVFLMVGLSNPEPTKGLLQMLVPTMPGETYNEVEIKTIQAPTPIPFSIAFPGDTLFVSNNVDKMKPTIDLLKSGSASNLFPSLTPPLDPATPRYSMLMLNSSLLTDVVVPLATMFGQLPQEAQGIIGKVTSVLDEVRASSEMDGAWQSSKISLYLKPPAN